MTTVSESGARVMTAEQSRLAIVVSNLGHLFTHTYIILYATAVLHLPTVFNIPYGEMLGFASLGLVLYGAGALPAGWFADRWSKVGMMVIFFFGISLATFLTGMANEPRTLYLGLSLLGLSASIYHPVGIAWLIACARRQGLSLGLNSVFGNLGSALAPVFVGLMIDHFSWRMAFFVPSILAFIVGCITLYAWYSGRIVDAEADAAPVSKPPQHAMRRVLLVLTLTMACSGLIYAGLLNTIPKLFQNGLGDILAGSYTELGLVAGAVIGVSSFSSLAGGWMADRLSPRTVYLIFVSLVIPPLLLITSMSGTALLIAVLLALSFNVAFAAAENMLVALYTPFKWRSLAFGARYVLALGVGGITVRVAGILYDRYGDFNVLYLVFGAVALISVIGVYMLPRQPDPARVSSEVVNSAA